MVVLKFGGGALKDSSAVKNAVDYIIKMLPKNPVVVVSALKDVTDLLIDSIAQSLTRNHNKFLQNLSIIKKKHEMVADDLITSANIKNHIFNYFNKKIIELTSHFNSISILRDCPKKSHDSIISLGERFSAHLVTCLLKDNGFNAEQVDGERLIVTDSNFGCAYPKFDITSKKIKSTLSEILLKRTIPIITGFIGANEKGETTTLGRGGSDFSASIIAYSLDAEEVWYLKDVDGIMSADPKIVKDAQAIGEISYEEVAELSYFGGKILHPFAIHPLKKKEIPSYIKNVYKFSHSGTRISCDSGQNGKDVKAITFIDEVSLITVQSGGGAQGIMGRIFSSLEKHGIQTMMVSRSSSEQNICFIISEEDESKVLHILNEELEAEILKKKIPGITVQRDVSLISIIGKAMQHSPGIFGKLFSVLDRKEIGVILIAQGDSKLNISFVVNSHEAKKAIECIHQEFILGY